MPRSSSAPWSSETSAVVGSVHLGRPVAGREPPKRPSRTCPMKDPATTAHRRRFEASRCKKSRDGPAARASVVATTCAVTPPVVADVAAGQGGATARDTRLRASARVDRHARAASGSRDRVRCAPAASIRDGSSGEITGLQSLTEGRKRRLGTELPQGVRASIITRRVGFDQRRRERKRDDRWFVRSRVGDAGCDEA